MCVLVFKISHRPDGKIADALAPTLACTTANTSLKTTGGACATVTFKSYHRPYGSIADVLAPPLTHAQLRTLRSTIQWVCDTETLQISHRPHVGDSRVALVACRAVVSTSLLARSR